MQTKTTKFVFLGLLVSLVAGCSYEGAALKAENTMRGTLLPANSHFDQFIGKPTIDAARLSLRISDSYKELGDTAAANRDALSSGVIIAAGAGALGAATSVGSRELAQVAVMGVGLNELVRYTNQAGSAEAFYKSSDEMACIASRTVGFVPSMEHSDPKDTAVALEYIRKAELRLRSRLRRTEPDYTTVISSFATGIDSLLPPQVLDAQRTGGSLREILKTCLPQDDTEETSTDSSSTEPAPVTETEPASQPEPERPPNPEGNQENSNVIVRPQL